jgi:hypothetical protein
MIDPRRGQLRGAQEWLNRVPFRPSETSRGATVRRLALVVLVVLLGCRTTIPDGRRVRVVSRAVDGAGCEMLGRVSAHPAGRGGSLAQLKTATAALGGDTLLVVSPSGGERGVAYRCLARSGR